VKRFAIFSLTAALGLGGLTSIQPVQAGMFDMMNPGEWFGGNRDRYYDRGYDRGYGYGGPYGWGGGPYGWGGGPYGWGGGPYGWGGGPYGWGGGPYGGYGPGNNIVVTPQGSGSKQAPPQLPE
jgi:hypothetical protein